MQTPNNETRQRILDAAEELFSKRGYAAVRLRDIAGAVGMRHASLYYYAPKGKQQLFVEVMERNFARHLEGLAAAISGAGDDLRAQMYAVAEWLITQPPLDFGRMQQSDMREIGEGVAEGGQLPVEDRDHMRLGGVEHKIADPEIAVDDGRNLPLGDMRGQPFDQPLHIRVLARAGLAPLP